jgi:hypothetical protein
MTPFEKLTAEEKHLIHSYISCYAPYEHTSCCMSNDLGHILRHWNAEKENYLFDLFGGELIVSKQIKYEKSISELSDEISDKMYGSKFNPMRIFYDNYHAYINNVCDWSTSCLCDRLLNSRILAANKTNHSDFTITVQNPAGEAKTFSVPKGCKPVKVLGKIAEWCGIEGFEEFRIAHSQILNQKAITGKLCLSIHPMDYMTMSDNNYGWSSCMSWTERGGYRQGTVEMMNSNCTIVAYIAAAEPYVPVPGEMSWNNKKWRSLIVCSDDVICTVKNYPYYNNFINDQAVNFIAELAEKNMNRKYEEQIYTFGECDTDGFVRLEGKGIYDFNFHTDDHSMYNDFYSTTHHMRVCEGAFSATHTDGYSPLQAYIAPCHRLSYDDKEKYGYIDTYYFNYCGESQCVWCGGYLNCDYDVDEFDGLLCCSDCETQTTCECCGCFVGSNYSDLDGEILCECCFDDQAIYDPISYEYHHRDCLAKLCLIEEDQSIPKDASDVSWNYSCIYTEIDDGSNIRWNECFTVSREEVKKNRRIPNNPWYCDNEHFFIFENELTLIGKRMWDTYS